jgi:chromosome segregation ATPase
MAVLALAGLYLWMKRRKRKKAMEMNTLKADLSKAIDEYNKLQRQYETLQNANRLSQMETDALERESRDALKSMEDYGRLLEEMELDLANKDTQIHAYEQRLASLLSGKSEEALQASAVVGRMRELAVPKKENPLPSEKDWPDLLNVVSETLPSFHNHERSAQHAGTPHLRACKVELHDQRDFQSLGHFTTTYSKSEAYCE